MDEAFYQLELAHAKRGEHIAGADEAGRGPLAGPVVAAAVVLPVGDWIEGVGDSKKLSQKKREALYECIIQKALAWNVGIVDVETIEKINILEATRIAFGQAVAGLRVKPDFLYADQITNLPVDIPWQGIVKGDAKVYSIAAASILAKVTRDRIMREYDALYPAYGFAKHKGYGTLAHRQAIREYGPCPIHRMSFLGKILP